MYYGGRQPAYGGHNPMYYGSGQYGQYGSYGQYGGVPPEEGEGSLVGKITPQRMLRVISQRWLSVFVFLLIGLILAFAVYSVSPRIYEASSEFTMDMRRSSGRGSGTIEDALPDFGNTYAEIFNTRLPEWRSPEMLKKIVAIYRAKNELSSVPEDAIITALAESVLELQRNSRLITISVRSRDAKLAAALANAYAAAIEDYTTEENTLRCEKMVSQTHSKVEEQSRKLDQLGREISDFRINNGVDVLRSQRETINQSINKTTADILTLEGQEDQLVEWGKLLKEVQAEPEKFGSLSSGTPRAQEIATEYNAFLQAGSEHAALLASYTEDHPEVIAKAGQLEDAKRRFLDATRRALETGIATLQVTRNQLAALRQKQENFRNDLASVEQRIVQAETGLNKLESDRNIAEELYKKLFAAENDLRKEAESDNEYVRISRKAIEPQKPVLPNALIIFGAGSALSLMLGFAFVLVLDNLEDTVVNLADIEGRLALKVLAVFPHVRRNRREHVAKFAVEDRYSQFSEAVAGLRNLLDSPRYESMTHCLLVISTQPGEGKTITSTSMAISYAQAGRRTLHVDFDLRRPRLARIWEVKLDKEHSFSHVLDNIRGAAPDFAQLVNHTSVEGLDVICSLPPDGISPAAIFGSRVLPEFFAWARSNYDRVVIDSPPYGIVGDVVTLSTMVDAVIIMCCPDRTHFRPIQYCSRRLTEAGANILGVIVNDVEVANANAFAPGGHHHYGYGRYGYGYGYGYGPRKKASAQDRSAGAEPAGATGEQAASTEAEEAATDED